MAIFPILNLYKNVKKADKYRVKSSRLQKVLNHFVGLLLFAFIFVNAISVFAGPGRTTYQAKIVKPDGYPLEATSVNFKFTILDPAGSCILYSETYSSVNMSGTGGLISFSLGSGVKTYPASATTFEQVFSNITPSLSCDTGGPVSYSPIATDTRKIVMQFHDGTGWQTLPAMNINAVPYAMYANEAAKLNGLQASDFVQVSTVPTCTASEALRYTGAGFTCVAVGNSVTSGTVISALGYTPADGVSVTALSSSLTTTNTNLSSVSSTVFSVSSTVTSLQSSVAASFAAITSSQWTTSGTNIFYNIGNIGIGTTTPVTKLDVSGGVRIGAESTTCAASLAGTLRYNASNVEFCNGTSWQAFGVSGAGINNFNGSTSGTQSFANATGGTAPAFNTSNGVHTLNIPLANTGSVTAGLISNADYTTFTNKITSSAASIAQVLGYTPASSAMVSALQSDLSSVSSTANNALVKSNNLSDLTNITTARTNLGLGTFATASSIDLGSASATGTLAIARLPSFTGDATIAAASNTIILSNSGVTAGIYTKVIVDAKGRVTSGAQITSSDVTTALGYTPGNSTSGVTSLNGSASQTQTLANATGGTAPNFTTSNGVHTLNIPYASVGTTTAGLISNTDYVNFSNKITSSAAAIAQVLGYTPANSATTVSSQWATSGTNIFYNTGNVGIGTSTPVTKLDVSGGVRIGAESTTCAASLAGTLRYNASNVEFCNGSSWQAFGVSSSGLTSLNGSTSQTQTFANATGGTAPAFNTSNGVHTLNIPLANTGSVTAGLISNADYTTFTNKITSSAASIVQVLGYTPANDAASGTYAQKANNLSDLTNITTARTNLGLGTFATASSIDLGSASATGTLAIARLPSFTGDATIAAASNTIILSNSGVTAGIYTKVIVDAKGRVTSGAQIASSDVTTALGYTPASASAATQWTTSGSAIYYNTGNVGVGVTNPSHALDIADNGNDAGFKYTSYSNSYAADMRLFRSRGTQAGPTALISGDILGSLNFYGYGSATAPTARSAAIEALAMQGYTSTARGAALAFRVAASGTTTAIEAMRINHDGNVGIGIPNPTAILNLVAGTSSNASLKFTSGTLLTSPQSGTMEYDGSYYYLTDGSNTRRTIATGSSAGTIDNANNINSSGNITLTPTGSVIVSSTTASTDSQTGALVVKGGVGIAGTTNIAQNLNVSGSSMIDGSLKLSSMTSGSVLFAGVNGTVTQDNSNFYWDDVNDRLGIGTKSSISALSIKTSTANNTTGDGFTNLRLEYAGGYNAGNIGAGVTFAQQYVDPGTDASPIRVGGIFGVKTQATGNFGGGLAFFRQPAGAANMSEAMRIDQNGYVGIGTSAPTARLQIGDGTVSTSNQLIFGKYETSTESYLPLIQQKSVLNAGVGNDLALAAQSSSGGILFYTGVTGVVNQLGTSSNTVRMAITNTGNVGIGTTNPNATSFGATAGKILAVASTGAADTKAVLELSGSTAGTTGSNKTGELFFTQGNGGRYNSSIFGFRDGVDNSQGIGFSTYSAAVGSEKMRITSSGNVGIGTSILSGGSGNLVVDGLLQIKGSDSSTLLHLRGQNTDYSGLKVKVGPSNVSGGSDYYDFTIRPSVGAGVSTASDQVVVRINNTYSRTYADAILNPNGGNVGIGTSSPSGKLNVIGDWNGSYGAVTLQGDKPTIRLSSTSATIGGGNHWLIHQGNGDPTNPGSLDFYQSTDGTTWGTAKLKIAPNGHVGIGTTAPTQKLENAGGRTAFGGDGANYHWFTTNTGTTESNNLGYGFKGTGGVITEHQFKTSGTTRVMIDSVGYVGIGVTNPISKVQVNGTIIADQFVKPDWSQELIKLSTLTYAGSFSSTGSIVDGNMSTYADATSLSSSITIDLSSSASWAVNGNSFYIALAGYWNSDMAGGLWTIQKGDGTTWTTLATNLGAGVYYINNTIGYVNPPTTNKLRFIPTSLGGGGIARLSEVSVWGTNVYGSENIAKGNAYFSGNVGIGTTAPDDKFVVNNGTTIGRYTASGWTHSSDARLKREVKTLDNSLAKIVQLRGVAYTFNSDPNNTRQLGFIAQEVEQIFPQVVLTDKKGFKSMIYANLVAPVVEAIKELFQRLLGVEETIKQQSKEIEMLKAKSSSLEEQNKALKDYLCEKDPNAKICK